MVTCSTPGYTGGDFLYFRHDLFGALQRSGIGELDIEVEIALVFVGNEADREFSTDPQSGDRKAGEHDHSYRALAEQRARDADVGVGRPLKGAVEPREEFREQPFLALCFWLQDEGRKCGAERERVEGREDHRDRDGHCELLIEPSGDAGNECRRYEHRREHQRNTDHRAGDLLHRFESCFLGRKTLFDMALYGFDYHDRVINYQADRQAPGRTERAC